MPRERRVRGAEDFGVQSPASRERLGWEAAYLRAALLIGIVREDDVTEWAQLRLATIEASDPAAAALIELLLGEEALSPMREALRPLEAGVELTGLTLALLAGIAIDDALTPRTVADRLRLLGLLRREMTLPSTVADAIDGFRERAMLCDANVGHARAPDRDELQAWLRSVQPTAYFRFEFDAVDEASAFLAAASRTLDRNRTAYIPERSVAGDGWLVLDGDCASVVLNERTWRFVVREFSPIPIVSRIPATSLPADAVAVLDEAASPALGSDDARGLLHRGLAAMRGGRERRTPGT